MVKQPSSSTARQIAIAMIAMSTACGSPTSDDLVGQAESAIINGVLDDDHSSVGALLLEFDGESAADFCSGSLIAPAVVLTAAHCVEDASPRNTRFALQLTGPFLRVQEFFPFPGRLVDGPSVDNDLALVVLRDPVDIAPTPLSGSMPVAGMAVTLVGVGDQTLIEDSEGNVVPDGTSAGLRRAGVKQVADVIGRHFTVEGREGNACAGDSGGAVFAMIDGKEEQVGVISSANVTFDLSAHVSVAAFVDWLRTATGEDLALSGSAGTAEDLQPNTGDDALVLEGGCSLAPGTPAVDFIPILLIGLFAWGVTTLRSCRR